jgi:hypothetical protein
VLGTFFENHTDTQILEMNTNTAVFIWGWLFHPDPSLWAPEPKMVLWEDGQQRRECYPSAADMALREKEKLLSAQGAMQAGRLSRDCSTTQVTVFPPECSGTQENQSPLYLLYI